MRRAAANAADPGLPSPLRAGSAITTSTRSPPARHAPTSLRTIVAARPARFTEASSTDERDVSMLVVRLDAGTAARPNSPTPAYASTT